MLGAPDPEVAHQLSKVARWLGWAAVHAALGSLWVIAVGSPLLALVALIVWPWALPLIALAIAAAIYSSRKRHRLAIPSVQEMVGPPVLPQAPTARRLSSLATLVLAAGVLAWPAVIIVAMRVVRLHRPPTHDVMVWLYTWQWWVVVVVVTGSVVIGLLGRAAVGHVVRRRHEKWGTAVAAAGIRVGVAAGVVGLVMLGLVSGSARGVSKLRWGVCLRDLMNVNLALNMYLADNDDVFPPGDVWCDLMDEYVRNRQVMICPEAPQLRSGYALNSALAGRRLRVAEGTRHVVTLFESDAGWNAAGGPESLPQLPRHGNGDNYGFLDGNCVWEARRATGRDRRGRTVYAAETVSDYVRWDAFGEIAPQPADDAGE